MAFTHRPISSENITSSSNGETSALYPILLCEEEYFTLYRFLERANNFIESRKGRLSNSYYDSLDGLACNAQNNSVIEITLYDSLALLYKHIKYPGNTFINPGMIQLSKGCNTIDLNPTTFIPSTKELKKEMEDVYLLLHGPFYTNDISADLFQYSTLYDVLSEYDIREMVNRLYNLPILQGYQLSLFNNLGLFDSDNIKDLDSFFRGSNETCSRSAQ